MFNWKTAAIAAVMVASPATIAVADAQTLTIDVTGATTEALQDDFNNQITNYFLGANAHVTSVAYNVTIEAFDPSWLSESAFGFTDSQQIAGVYLTPGFEDDVPGLASYSGSVDLTQQGIDFFLLADGFLRTEFFELYNDSAPNPDAIWRSGTITIGYQLVDTALPEPATWGLMILGFGAVGGAMRRRSAKVAYVA